MIVVDTSALVAIVLGEPEAERLLAALQSDVTLLSAGSLVEAQIVVEARQGLDAARDLALLVDGAVETVVPVDEVHATAAVEAWRRYGKGRHQAALNFGDCLTYATAHVAGASLLFKGSDFSQTDLPLVRY